MASSTRRLKNLVVDISDYKKRLDSLDCFLFHLEYKHDRNNSSNNAANANSPPVKMYVSQQMNNSPQSGKNKKSTNDKKSKSRKSNASQNSLTEFDEDYIRKYMELRREEKRLKNKIDILRSKIDNLNSRKTSAASKMQPNCESIEELEERIKKLENFNNEFSTAEQDDANELLRLKVVVDTKETENKNRKINLEIRKAKLNEEIQKYNDMHANSPSISRRSVLQLSSEQQERRMRIIKEYEDIDDLIRRNLEERARIEESYRKKVKKIATLQNTLNKIGLLIITIHDENTSLSKLDAEEKSLIINKNTLSRLLNSTMISNETLDFQIDIPELQREIIRNETNLKLKRAKVEALKKEVDDFERLLDEKQAKIEALESHAYTESANESDKNKTEISSEDIDISFALKYIL